jgi:hypothetical protein
MAFFTRHEAEDYHTPVVEPLTFGGALEASLALPPAIPVDRGRMRRPRGPGLPPLAHPPLLLPEAYRLAVPQMMPGYGEEDDEPPRPLVALMGEAALTDAGAQTFSQRFDPLYPFLVYLALGFGTHYVGLTGLLRYTIMWTVLIALGAFLTLVDSDYSEHEMRSASLGWGISFGLVFSLPLLILVSSGLGDMVGLLYPDVGPAALIQSVVFVSPLGETLFFRGAMQERRGLVPAIAAAGIAGIVLYWPVAIHSPVYLAAAAIFTTVLAGVYGFVRGRYGLSAAFVCQVTVNVMLLLIPGLLAG